LTNFYFSKVAFPKEHGSWGFFLEPIILSLIIAYSQNGMLIAICSFLLFLAYQPVSYIIKQTPKFLLPSAYLYLFIYLFIAGVIFLFLVLNNEKIHFLIPFLVAIIFMIVFKLMEFKNLNRNIIVELIAPISVTLMAISVAISGGENLIFIIGFAIVLLSRSIETTFFVNNKLKLFKGYSYDKKLVDLIGIVFLLIIIVLSLYKVTPYFSILAIVLLMLRAHVGLLEGNKNEKVKIVGIKEFIYGFLFVVINAVGYSFGI